MSVAVLDIDKELPAVVESLGPRASGFDCDITSTSAIRKAAGEIAKTVGRVGVLVNNAGMAKKAAFLDTPPATQRDILALNLIAALDVTRAFLPSIIDVPCGRVIMMSSDG